MYFSQTELIVINSESENNAASISGLSNLGYDSIVKKPGIVLRFIFITLPVREEC